MDDDYSRLLKDLDVAGSLRRAIDDASLRHVRDTASILSERLTLLDDFATRQSAAQFAYSAQPVLDAFRLSPNVLDFASVGHDVARAVSDTLRPPTVANIDKLLAGMQQLTRPFADLEIRLRDWTRPPTLELTALTSAYDRIELLQQQLADKSAALSYTYSDALRPLLAAESTWARMVQIPSSAAAIARVASAAQVLFDDVYDFYSTVSVEIGDAEPSEEEAEHALALANERLGAAFEERDPLRLIRDIVAFLNQLKAGAIKIAPKGLYIILLLLLDNVGALIYSKVTEPMLSSVFDRPRVEKRVVSQAKRVRQEIPHIPANARSSSQAVSSSVESRARTVPL